MALDNIQELITRITEEAQKVIENNNELKLRIESLNQEVEKVQKEIQLKDETSQSLIEQKDEKMTQKKEVEEFIEKEKAKEEKKSRKKESLLNQIKELEEKRLKEKGEIDILKQKASEAMTKIMTVKSMEDSVEGYKKSLALIADQVPSQKESIAVLIALSEYENLTIDQLANKAKIGPLILKRDFLPKLMEQNLITIENEIVNLID
ncbi:MAG: hypothetical protein ACXAC7_08815 [Candidatus Hodarchaeales archaeon]|jgi:chromosome segregation ATPase